MVPSLKLLSFLAFAVFCSAAPQEESAECKIAEKDDAELVKCCKLDGTLDQFAQPILECARLVKEKPDKGPPVPEGFECMDTCLFSKLGWTGVDNKLDAEKLTKKFAEFFKGDWTPPSDAALKKCLPKAETTKGSCSNGADVFKFCLVRELYMNCPASSWTKSDLCTANVARLEKCPHSLPFLPGSGLKKN